MGKNKLLKKLLNPDSDANWTFNEIKTLLSALGYAIRDGKGSHFHFIKDNKRITIASHNNEIKKATVSDVRNAYLEQNQQRIKS